MRLRFVGTLALLVILSSAQARNLSGPACNPPDLTGVAPVALALGAGDPAGSADPIPGGRWELTDLLYRPSIPVTITGEATGVLDLASVSPTSGDFSAALEVDITAPAPEMRSESGAGSYQQAGGLLEFTNQCGDALTLSGTVYRVDRSGAQPVLTLWGQIEIPIQDPFPITVIIELEADFTLVEPQIADDPIFDDRFELP